MRTILKGGQVINVFTGEIERADVLIQDQTIIGVGDYSDAAADTVEDVSGRVICPSFMDGHIHIESTMLLPREFAKICTAHGTCAVVTDPHEIVNVCGTVGFSYMMEASENLPMDIFFMLPSCVPATPFDESGSVFRARDMDAYYSNPRVLGLAEVMNYPGVIYGDEAVHDKLAQAKRYHKIINGHAPLLSGRDLDLYISYGIQDDHECTSYAEAAERIRKGQWIMIRQGTSAQNLRSLIELFEPPFAHRCLLVTDDKHPWDLMTNGHIDSIIRQAVRMGKSPITAIQMATIQAAQCFGLRGWGAVAPGYLANLLVLKDLNTVDIRDVYFKGKLVCRDKEVFPFGQQEIEPIITKAVTCSMCLPRLTPERFRIEPQEAPCRVIQAIPGELLTNEVFRTLDFSKNNGVDPQRDIIKLAVCERHLMTGHVGLGYLEGLGLRKGAIASTVSHDSHNLIVAGTNDADMALAANTIIDMNGGLCVVCDGEVISRMPLPIAGLMSEQDIVSVARENQQVRDAARQLGESEGIEPFMHLAFVSLPVIPSLKMTTKGLIDVNRQKLVPLFETGNPVK